MEIKSNLLFQDKTYQLKNGADFPIIIADQLKSPENLGHIIRLAANFNCRLVLFVGDSNSIRESKIKKVAGAAYERVDWKFCTIESVPDLVPSDYRIIAIETCENSKSLTKEPPPPKSAIILGNEIRGISTELLQICKEYFHIPMLGFIPSMNVTHACCAALFAWTNAFVE